jgi:hypothetical protein
MGKFTSVLAYAFIFFNAPAVAQNSIDTSGIGKSTGILQTFLPKLMVISLKAN